LLCDPCSAPVDGKQLAHFEPRRMPLHTAGGASGRERTRFAYAVFCLSKACMRPLSVFSRTVPLFVVTFSQVGIL